MAASMMVSFCFWALLISRRKSASHWRSISTRLLVGMEQMRRGLATGVSLQMDRQRTGRKGVVRTEALG